MSSRPENVNEAVLKLTFFIIWPFGAFLFSLLRRPASRVSYCIYFLFGLLFCWSVYYSPHESLYIDFVGIVENFYDTQLTFFQLWDEIWATLTISPDIVRSDFYVIFIYWLTKQISVNYHLMYVIAGVPFLYCMLSSLKYITRDAEKFKPTLYGYAILFLFVIPCSIFNIQNFRYSTALWVCVFCILKVFYDHQGKYIFLFLLLPYIHYSYWFVVISLAVYWILRNHFKWQKLLFFVSIPFALIPVDMILSHLMSADFLPLILAEKGELYFSDYANENWGMYANGVRSLFKAIQSVIYIVATILMTRRTEVTKNASPAGSLLHFFCVFLAMVNFVNVVPVIGERFYLLSRIIGIFLWFKIMYPRKRYFMGIFVLGCALEIYTISDLYLKVLSWDFFYSNVFSLIYKYLDVSFYS